MTQPNPDQKPKPLEKFESLAERRIREAQAEGRFDALTGFGKPLASLDGPDDENWWIKNKLREEGLVILPPILEARRERGASVGITNAAETSLMKTRRVASLWLRCSWRVSPLAPPLNPRPAQSHRIG